MVKLRGMRRLGLMAVLVLALVALAACGNGGDNGGGDGGAAVEDGRIVVSMTEYAFAPKDIEVNAGEPVTFVLENDGSLEHDMAFDDLDEQSDEVAAGDSAEFTVTFEEVGTYPFYCTVPGHKESGMVGEVVAK